MVGVRHATPLSMHDQVFASLFVVMVSFHYHLYLLIYFQCTYAS
jgi:hypothetical protein